LGGQDDEVLMEFTSPHAMNELHYKEAGQG